MSAGTGDLQPLVDELLAIIGTRLMAGQITIHLSEGRVQKVEVNNVYRPPHRPERRQAGTVIVPATKSR